MPKGEKIKSNHPQANDPRYQKFIQEFEFYKSEQEKLRGEYEKIKERVLTPIGGEELSLQQVQEKLRRKDLRKKRMMSKREWKERQTSAKFIILECLSLYKETGQKRFLKKLNVYERFMTNEQKNIVRAALQPEFGI